MLNIGNPDMVQIEYAQRREFLTQEYDAARADQEMIMQKAIQVIKWANQLITKMRSGMGQGGAGTFQPSA